MTVSRVINREPVVRPTTREKVERSIAALNYEPNDAARKLAGADDTRFALLYNNPSSSYLSEFLVGSLEEARRNNVHLVVEYFDEFSTLESALQHVLRGGIDGVILPPPLGDLVGMRCALMAADIPVVTVASGLEADRISAVSIDDRQAAYEMTAHLLGLGHSRIGFIRGNPNQATSGRRFEGYMNALADKGIALDDALVVQGLFSYRSGLDAASELLDLLEQPTAIFASNDDMAAAAVAVAHRRGLDVPRDLTVCGFDDTSLATTTWPELTTIRQPISEMSRAAVELLMHDIRSRKALAGPSPSHRLLDYKLIRRDSDAVPRR